jgi:hypothetical protein
MNPSDPPPSSDRNAMLGELRKVRFRLWGSFIATMVLGVIGFMIGFPELLGGVKVINESDLGGLDDSIASMEGALFWVIPLAIGCLIGLVFTQRNAKRYQVLRVALRDSQQVVPPNV